MLSVVVHVPALVNPSHQIVDLSGRMIVERRKAMRLVLLFIYLS